MRVTAAPETARASDCSAATYQSGSRPADANRRTSDAARPRPFPPDMSKSNKYLMCNEYGSDNFIMQIIHAPNVNYATQLMYIFYGRAVKPY